MIAYSASTVFHKEKEIDHYASFATKYCYESMEGFMDFCEIIARQNKMFATSDVHINCMKIQINEDGTTNKLDNLVRSFKNYKGF